MKWSIYFLSLILLLSGCSSQKSVSSSESIILKDVAYGTDARNIMDVKLPANRNKETPFVLLIHGGAWTIANKENVQDFMDTLYTNGISVASINHRYANHENVHYKEMLADVDAALNYCISQADNWNVRKNGFVMSGVSSGAHLAMLYSYTTDKKINAITEFCGPVDFTSKEMMGFVEKAGLKEVLVKMTGKDYDINKDIDPEFFSASPVRFVKPIPILIVHGTDDKVVPFIQAQILVKALEDKKVKNKFIPIQGAGHDLNLKDSSIRKLVYSEVVKWVKQYGQ